VNWGYKRDPRGTRYKMKKGKKNEKNKSNLILVLFDVHLI
jgi:hypothetical protein